MQWSYKGHWCSTLPHWPLSLGGRSTLPRTQRKCDVKVITVYITSCPFIFLSERKDKHADYRVGYNSRPVDVLVDMPTSAPHEVSWSLPFGHKIENLVREKSRARFLVRGSEWNAWLRLASVWYLLCQIKCHVKSSATISARACRIECQGVRRNVRVL